MIPLDPILPLILTPSCFLSFLLPFFLDCLHLALLLFLPLSLYLLPIYYLLPLSIPCSNHLPLLLFLLLWQALFKMTFWRNIWSAIRTSTRLQNLWASSKISSHILHSSLQSSTVSLYLVIISRYLLTLYDLTRHRIIWSHHCAI